MSLNACMASPVTASNADLPWHSASRRLSKPALQLRRAARIMPAVPSLLIILLAALQIGATNPPPVVKAKVVLARDPSAVKGLQVDAPKVRALVATGIQTLTGKTDEAEAWRTMLSSNDVVGIKIST